MLATTELAEHRNCRQRVLSKNSKWALLKEMKARQGVMTAAVASELTASSRTAFMLDDTQFVQTTFKQEKWPKLETEFSVLVLRNLISRRDYLNIGVLGK